MVISSSSVPNQAWLNQKQKVLDSIAEDGVDSDVEVDSEAGDSEEDLGLVPGPQEEE